jgi:hypothetical protein
MPDEPSTSHAKNADPQGNIKGPDLGERFEQAKAQPQPAPEMHGSDMVKKDRPKNNNNPPFTMRMGPDRVAHNTDLGHERQQAEARNALAEKFLQEDRANQAARARDLNHDRSKDDHEK